MTAAADMRAAVIGLGMIGGPVAVRLAGHGVPVAVFDLRREACDRAERAGAERCDSSADAAARADVIAIAVVNDAQVLDVVTGPQGVLVGARPGAIVVIHSTVEPATVRRAAAAAIPRHVRVLDAGVSTLGAPEPGMFQIFVGGDEADLDAARPVLEVYGHHIEHVGALGAGMTVKLIRNLVGYGLMVVAHEGLALAEAAGIDLDLFRRVLEESDVVAQLNMVLNRPTARAITESDAALAFGEELAHLRRQELVSLLESTTAIMEKDLDELGALAAELGIDAPIDHLARRLIRRAMMLSDPVNAAVDRRPGPTT